MVKAAERKPRSVPDLSSIADYERNLCLNGSSTHQLYTFLHVDEEREGSVWKKWSKFVRPKLQGGN